MRRSMFGTASWGFREMELEGQLSCVCRLGFEIHELDIENAPGDLPADADAEYELTIEYNQTPVTYTEGHT